MASWLLASTPTLAYSLTIVLTAAYPTLQHSVLLVTHSHYLRYVLSCVPMCPGVRGYVYLSVGLCVGGCASVTWHSRLQDYLLLHPE